jgi:hypothetical protein
VGFGRPFLYANATHGEEGITRAIESEIHDQRWPKRGSLPTNITAV